MEEKSTLFCLLRCAVIMSMCFLLHSAYGAHFFVMKSATCLRANINCMMDYHGVMAYQRHLQQYEEITGCSTAHLAMWLWNREPFTCILKNNTEDSRLEVEEYVSDTSPPVNRSLPSIPVNKEKHRYICVTDGEMSRSRDLCNPDDIQKRIMAEEMNDFHTIVGSCVGAFVIVTMLVLIGLYKRRTRERPSSYLQHVSNRSGSDFPNLSSEVENCKHYTLPKTASAEAVNLVRPALRRTRDIDTSAPDVSLYSLPNQFPDRTHRGLGLGKTLSVPDLHEYVTLEAYFSDTKTDQHKHMSDEKPRTNQSHDYVGCFIYSGASSAPDMHMYAEVIPCTNSGEQCDC